MTSSTALGARMRRLEARHGFATDVTRATDAQLHAIVRHGYRDLVNRHGSLPKAVEALRQNGEVALAEVIAQDIRGRDAQRH